MSVPAAAGLVFDSIAGALRGSKFEFHEVDREFADALLHVGCLSEGASEFKAAAIYRAVRIANVGAGWQGGPPMPSLSLALRQR